MFRTTSASILSLATLMATVVAEEITFGPVQSQPGQKVRMISKVDGINGSIKRAVAGEVSNGTMSFTSSRDVTWIFRAPAADGTRRGMAKILNMGREGEVMIDGKKEKSTKPSALNGIQVAFSKPPHGDWSFELDGTLETRQVDQEIKELTHYLKRDWYPEKPVKIGDSWEFNPDWIKSIIEKDLHSAQTIGTMQLRQVRHTASGKMAVISVRVESTGGDFRPDGTESSASIDLKGEFTLDLNTMLDQKTTLSGSLRTHNGDLVNYTTTEVPITITVEKFFTRD